MSDLVTYFTNKLTFETDSWDLNDAMKNSSDVVVLDVRTQQSFDRCHIEGAISFPHQRITEDNVRDLDRSKSYVVYCDGLGCNAATNGALKLAKLRFNVRELTGGLTWWRDHNYPVVNG
jgi:rhodanese-related sulfurtransferase